MYGVQDVDWDIYWKPGHDHCGGSRGVVTLPAQLWFDFMEEGNEED